MGGAEKEETPKGRAEKTNKKKKEGKDVVVQKAKAEGGACEKKEQQKFAQEALAKPLDKEGAAATIQSSRKYIHREGAVEAKEVHAQTVFENSVDANSSVLQTLTHTGAEKEAIPKGRAEKTNKKKKEGKDVAVQKAKAEEAAISMNQKSCRNKAKQGQKPEQEQHRKLAKDAQTRPLDKEGAAATIQSSWKSSRQKGAVEANKAHAQTVFENSVDATRSVPQTLTHTGAEKEAVPKG